MIADLAPIADGWWSAALHLSWQAALVGLIVLALCRLAPRIPPTIRYALIALALLKFLVPPDVTLRCGLLRFVPLERIAMDAWQPIDAPRMSPALEPTTDARATSGGVTAATTATATTATRSRAGASLGWRETSLLVYVAGCFVALLLLVRDALAFRRLAAKASTAELASTNEAMRCIQREVGVSRTVRLRRSDAIDGPVCGGLARPTILLPTRITRSDDPAELRVVLAHELIHLRHRDPWAHAALGVMSILFWFHPVFWMLAAELRRVQEDWCDDEMLARGTSASDYCRALLDVARASAGSAPSRMLAMVGDAPSLARRFRRLHDPTKNLGGSTMLSRLAVLAFALLLLPGVDLNAGSATLPSASAVIDGEDFVVTVDARGRLEAAGRSIDPDVLGELARFVGANKQVDAKVLASPRAPVERVARTLQALKDGGLGAVDVTTSAGVGARRTLEDGLRWLASGQGDDGSWRGGDDATTVRDTSLAALAFLGAGNTPKHGPHAEPLRRAIDFLAQHESSQDGPPMRIARAIATVAVVEAFGLSGDGSLKAAAQDAVDHAAAMLDQATPRDPAMVYWALLAQFSGRDFELDVDDQRIESVLQDVRARDASVGLVDRAGGMLLRMFGGERPGKGDALGGDAITACAAEVVRDLDRDRVDYRAWFFGGYLVYQVGGEPWKQWRTEVIDRVVLAQEIDGAAAGSWPPAGDSPTAVSATARSVLTLEVMYRYARLISG